MIRKKGMMKGNINTIEELKQEITRLNMLKVEQEAYLGNQFVLLKGKIDRPVQVFSAIASSIPGVNLVRGLFSKRDNGSSGIAEKDWMSRFLRIGIPFLLNRTLLKQSGWFKKTLVLLASETAAGQVGREGLIKALSKITDFVRPSKKESNKKKAKVKPQDSMSQNEALGRSEDDQILGI